MPRTCMRSQPTCRTSRTVGTPPIREGNFPTVARTMPLSCLYAQMSLLSSNLSPLEISGRAEFPLQSSSQPSSSLTDAAHEELPESHPLGSSSSKDILYKICLRARSAASRTSCKESSAKTSSAGIARAACTPRVLSAWEAALRTSALKSLMRSVMPGSAGADAAPMFPNAVTPALRNSSTESLKQSLSTGTEAAATRPRLPKASATAMRSVISEPGSFKQRDSGVTAGVACSPRWPMALTAAIASTTLPSWNTANRALMAKAASVPIRPRAFAAATRTSLLESCKHTMSAGTAMAACGPGKAVSELAAAVRSSSSSSSRHLASSGAAREANRPRCPIAMATATRTALFESARHCVRTSAHDCTLSARRLNLLPTCPRVFAATSRTRSFSSTFRRHATSPGIAGTACVPNWPSAATVAFRASALESRRLLVSAGTAKPARVRGAEPSETSITRIAVPANACDASCPSMNAAVCRMDGRASRKPVTKTGATSGTCAPNSMQTR
mmetsp:Transcript_108256/g.305131  ORF Transcript_108256/g.305131 Transcript_108256/m.305131 type:complete len:502 (+) Transcript_108256:213-1718(+)